MLSEPLPSQASHPLRDLYLARVQHNPGYSSRAFARDIGVSQSYMSLLLNGKRQLSWKQALRIALRLKLKEQDRKRFLRSLAALKSDTYLAEEIPDGDQLSLTLDRFRIIAEWYHLAILDLTTIKPFKPDIGWVAKTLGIKTVEVRDAVERLKRIGLLETTPKRWKKTQAKLVVATQHSDEAIRSFHRQMISKAIEALESSRQEDFDRRDITGITVAINSHKLKEAKLRIKKFRAEMADLLGSGDCDELYQLNLQLFSLIKKNPRELL
jgi:uncharacterized protein (TIGR02147 family)